MDRRFTLGTALPAFLVAALASAPAMAQEGQSAPAAPAARAAGSEMTVVVTAQRREQALEDVPISVQAFTGQTLEETGVRDLGQLIAFVPGASEGRGNASGIKSYQIRGVASFIGDSTVGYYLDEAAYTIPNRNYAPVARSFDIERVEVLRGPQGTLYGLGSMGGTIRFITADPDLERLRVRGALGYSDTDDGEDNYYTDLAVSMPLVKDKLAIRGVYSVEELGGYAESPSFPGDKNSNRIENYRFKVLARPTDDLTLKLSYHRNENADDWGRNLAVQPAASGPPTRAADPPRFPNSPFLGRNKQIYDMVTGYLSFDAGPVLIEASTGYIDREDRSRGPIILGPVPPPLPPGLTVIGDSESFVQELRLVSQTEGPLEYVLGYIYQEASNLEDIRVSGGPPISAVSIYDSRSWAVYGEASYGFLNDTLRPLIGLRFFEDDRDFRTQSRAPFLQPAFTRSEKFDAVSPRFNLSWEPSDNALYYINIAKGFRSGTFNTAAAVATNPGLVPFAVAPDEIWSYEVGAKWTAFDGRLNAEVAVYQFDWSDVQINYTAAAGVQVIRNAGEVQGQGIDLQARWRPIDDLVLDASANFNSTEFDSITNPSSFVSTPNIAAGKQLASVPENTYSFGATYTRPIGDDLGLYANASYTYIGEQGDVGDNFGRFGADHDLLRGRVGVERGPVGFYLFGDNLLNDDDAILISNSGVTRYYPRTIGAEVKFDF